VALAVLVGSVVLLSRSPLIRGEDPSQARKRTADDCSKRTSRRLQRIGATARGRYGPLHAAAALSGGGPLSRPAAEVGNHPRRPDFLGTSRQFGKETSNVTYGSRSTG
jgi:hypothetical protein